MAPALHGSPGCPGPPRDLTPRFSRGSQQPEVGYLENSCHPGSSAHAPDGTLLLYVRRAPRPPLWSPRRLPISNPLGALCSRTPPSSSALPTGRQTDMVEKIKVPAREPRALPRFLHMEKGRGRGKKIFPAVAVHDARPNLRPSSAGPRLPQRATAPSQSRWSFPQVGPSQQLTAAGGREVMCGPGCVPRPDSGSALHLAASPASCPRTLPGPEADTQPTGREPASSHAPGRDG